MSQICVLPKCSNSLVRMSGIQVSNCDIPQTIKCGSQCEGNETVVFYIIAILGSAVIAYLVILPLIRPHSTTPSDTASDIDVYKDQLSELDSDITRGVLTPEEAETSRVEISRRLLAAAKSDDAQSSVAPLQVNRRAAGGMFIALMAFAAGLYVYLGADGLPDQPLAVRTAEIELPAQDTLEAQFADTVDALAIEPAAREADLLSQLQDVLASRPDDIQGHRLLVTTLNNFRQYRDARSAQDRVMSLLGDTATGEDFSDHAETMIFAARGVVSAEANAALTEALARDATDRRARYYRAISFAQNQQPQRAIDIWASLLDEDEVDAPWKEPIRAQITRVAGQYGLPLPQQLLRGPSQADIAASEDMSAEDRAAMIEAMVEGLAERLATEGGEAAEWARLITALGVLGQTERADAIYTEARQTFAQSPPALEMIEDAARNAGLTQ